MLRPNPIAIIGTGHAGLRQAGGSNLLIEGWWRVTKWDPFWGNQTLTSMNNFEGYPENNNAFAWVG